MWSFADLLTGIEAEMANKRVPDFFHKTMGQADVRSP